MILTRRNLVAGGAVSAGLLLSGCDKLAQQPQFRAILLSGDKIHMGLQRALQNRDALAREFRPDQMSPRFRVNGVANPDTPVYNQHVAERFANWRLEVDGLVARPLKLSLADIAAFPQRAQITRHDCVEGWSAIGKWQGPQLSAILKAAGLRDAARYVVFTCADLNNNEPYYESIDLVDAFHPQTIMAWAMNDRRVSVGHGAPVRLRVERQLGYKQAKFVMKVTAVASLAGIGAGKGGYWEDRIDYDWYAGI